MAKNLKNVNELGNLPAYELLHSESLPDINSIGLYLRHKKTGAKVAVVTNDDDNKVFTIGFRTPPVNSTGVPHILEHSVLCGSKEFPSKDPFVELAKGSLNTFLNAMTYPDKTVYPVASCNDKDFQNLMHVYLDAVFYPNIYKEEKIFMQEGWHYELESEEGELTYNGVVYNEMKGAFSSPESQLFRTIMNSLFPDTAYGVESGGDPKHIPELSYEEFLQFHSTLYHPSNSYIYLYGDMEIEEKLNWIDEQYLNHFDEIKVESEITEQKPFEKPQEMIKNYPLSETEEVEGNAYLSYNVAIGNSLDTKATMALSVLEYVLLSSPGAPIKQALLDAGIGKDIITSYDAETYQPVLSIIAKNSDMDKKEEFLRIIQSELEKVVAEGLDEKSLKAAINFYEFRAREADYGRLPKGIKNVLSMLTTWLYDESKPFAPLHVNVIFEFLKNQIGTDYYVNVIKESILENPHVSIVILEPKVGLTREMEEQVKQSLKEYKESLSVEEIRKIIDDTKALKQYQDEPSSKEDMEKIPLLSREDISSDSQELYIEEVEVEGIPLIHHDVFTNGIAYMKLIFDLTEIPKSLVPYVGLLSSILGYIDTEHYTFLELSNEVNIHTGGISFDVSTIGKKGSPTDYLPTFQVDVKVLYNEMDIAFDLLKEIISFTKLDDKKRLLEIVSEIKSRLGMYLTSSGHMAAIDRAMSYMSDSAKFNDEIKGISFFKFVEKLEADFDNQVEQLIKNLQRLMLYIFRKENLLISFTSDKDGLKTLEGNLLPFVEQLKGETPEEENTPYQLEQLNEGFKTSGQVQYVARVGNFFTKGYAYTGALDVLRVIMSYDYLWQNVRVKGGAYGAMCGFSSISGNGYFTSYRDPNMKETNEIYEKSVDFIRNFEADERGLTKYIIGTISGIDTPRTPRMKGGASITAYLTGTTYEDLVKQREEILGVTVEDIRNLAPIVSAVLSDNNICVIGNEKKIEDNKDMLKEVKSLMK